LSRRKKGPSGRADFLTLWVGRTTDQKKGGSTKKREDILREKKAAIQLGHFVSLEGGETFPQGELEKSGKKKKKARYPGGKKKGLHSLRVLSEKKKKKEGRK